MPAAAKGNHKQAPARRCCQGHPGRMRCPRSRQCLVVPGGPPAWVLECPGSTALCQRAVGQGGHRAKHGECSGSTLR